MVLYVELPRPSVKDKLLFSTRAYLWLDLAGRKARRIRKLLDLNLVLPL